MTPLSSDDNLYLNAFASKLAKLSSFQNSLQGKDASFFFFTSLTSAVCVAFCRLINVNTVHILHIMSICGYQPYCSHRFIMKHLHKCYSNYIPVIHIVWLMLGLLQKIYIVFSQH